MSKTQVAIINSIIGIIICIAGILYYFRYSKELRKDFENYDVNASEKSNAVSKLFIIGLIIPIHIHFEYVIGFFLFGIIDILTFPELFIERFDNIFNSIFMITYIVFVTITLWKMISNKMNYIIYAFICRILIYIMTIAVIIYPNTMPEFVMSIKNSDTNYGLSTLARELFVIFLIYNKKFSKGAFLRFMAIGEKKRIKKMEKKQAKNNIGTNDDTQKVD